jgi:competence protein ComGC
MKKKTKSKNLTKILLIVLIVLVAVLIVISLINLSKTKSDLNEINKTIVDSNLIDANINVEAVNNVPNIQDVNLNDIVLPESEFVKEYFVTEENINDLKNIYSFAFNENSLEEYNYKMTEVGDLILEFKDYILVYDSENEEVKSMWFVESISN